jgi:hypothetical protein
MLKIASIFIFSTKYLFFDSLFLHLFSFCFSNFFQPFLFPIWSLGFEQKLGQNMNIYQILKKNTKM